MVELAFALCVLFICLSQAYVVKILVDLAKQQQILNKSLDPVEAQEYQDIFAPVELPLNDNIKADPAPFVSVESGEQIINAMKEYDSGRE